ncbi:MAG TPA: uroporphyrinogen decarboxylase, partial [Anaerolineae bacterium]|nr:uroporphyrinogen decarboxylase [Anaerolineae bacterium]
MSSMTKRARLEAAIRGDEPDRVPVALWRHFPGDDQDPAALATSTLGFQQQYDFDFIKVTPASSFAVRDWGVEDIWTGNQEGTRDYSRQPVRSPEQWQALPRLETDQGALGAQLYCLERIHDAV